MSKHHKRMKKLTCHTRGHQDWCDYILQDYNKDINKGLLQENKLFLYNKQGFQGILAFKTLAIAAATT